jgi:hypothetical protein
MFKLSLLVPAAAALVLAGEGIYHAVASRQQVAVSCDEFRRAQPASPRVLVTGCDINFTGAGYRESSGQVEELYLPARPAGDQAVAAPLVVATRDPAAIALVRTVLGGGRRATSEQSLGVMQTVGAQLRLTDAIDGLVRTGIIERLRSRRILSGLAPPIAENAPVVDLHGTPDLLTPGLALLAGALLTLLAFWPSRRNLPATAAVEPAATSQALPIGFEPASLESSQYDPEHAFDELAELREFPTSPHARSSAVALPRLLLLAIDVSSGPEAIESAPSLGSRADVAAMLRAVISDLSGDERQSVLSRPDGSVKVDLGRSDPVPTVVVEARGEAGVALVKEVLLMTGWRAFAPKTGLFVSADDLEALAALAGEGPLD